MNPLTTLADGGLAHKARKGNRAAFEEIYRRHSPAIFRFALHMSGDAAIADEVVQEVFLQLLRDRLAFDPQKGGLSSFLLGVVRNAVRKHFREWKPVDEFGEDVELASRDHDLLEDLTRRESVERLRSAIASLPGSYREAVVLCELEEMSYEEAAAILGCPIGTVRSRLSRARALLAAKLGTKVKPETLASF